MGRKVLLPVSGASAAEHHSTSFKHALFWLMRNLFKIPRGGVVVNGSGFMGVSQFRRDNDPTEQYAYRAKKKRRG